MLDSRLAAALALILALSPAVPGARAAEEPTIGGRCETCRAPFVGMPKEIRAAARIAPEDQPGEPMVLSGVVTDTRGEPVPGVIVYAYHTDDRGIYPEAEELEGTEAERNGSLRGWARTDEEGRYAFHTIRPAGYPGTEIPAHVHMHVIEPGRCTYYIDDVHFLDDDRLPERMRTRHGGRGGPGLVMPERTPDGVWRAERDIVLGLDVPRYRDCGR